MNKKNILLDQFEKGNFNINIAFKTYKDIIENYNEGKSEIFYFCRELLTADHNYRNSKEYENIFYLYPTYNLNYNFPIKDFDEFNNTFYNIDYKKFHNNIADNCFKPNNVSPISNFGFIKPIKAPDEYRTQNPFINITYNEESLNQGYILQPYNVPVDSWNLLVIRSYMLAAFYTSISPKDKEQFIEDEFGYMSRKFQYYSQSYKAIKLYTDKIYGNEEKYKYINNYSGLLDFIGNTEI
jgi:hypothetical protein